MLCMSDGQHCLHCVRNAWQSLGNMSPDAAMEQYVALLSDKVPGWMEDHSDVSPLLSGGGIVQFFFFFFGDFY